MNIAIVDDLLDDALNLKRHLEKYLPGYITYEISIFNDSSSFFNEFKPDTYDLLFLDIYMPDSTGIDIARKVRQTDNNVRIVFCSTSNDFASESYGVGASYYMLKPINEEQFTDMITVLLNKYLSSSAQIILPDKQIVTPYNIIFTSYFNHKITIYEKNKPPVDTWLKQSELVSILSDFPYFYACNRGTLVNFNHVQSYSNCSLIMTTGDVITVSKRLDKTIRESYAHFIFQKIREESN